MGICSKKEPAYPEEFAKQIAQFSVSLFKITFIQIIHFTFTENSPRDSANCSAIGEDEYNGADKSNDEEKEAANKTTEYNRTNGSNLQQGNIFTCFWQ